MARSRRWRHYRGWIAISAVAAIGAAIFLASRSVQPQAATPTYTTEAAQKGTLSVTVAGTGNLELRDQVSVTPGTSGTVDEVLAEEGDTVSQGDTLFTLDDSTVEAEIARALSSKRQAQQQVQQAELELAQAEATVDELADRSNDPSSTVTSSQISSAKKKVAIAETGLSSARASASSASIAYNDAVAARDDLEVAAPCDGVVWTVDVEAGDAVNVGGSDGGNTSAAASAASASSAPITIAREGELAVALAVNEVDVGSLEEGQNAELGFDAVSDLTVTGQVDEISREGTVDQGVVTYDVWISLDVTDKRLKPGMSASATIVTAVERDVLLVPNAAIKTDDDSGDSYVQVLDQGATAPRNVGVTTGLAGSTQTVIEDGIEEGTLVVTKTVTADSSDTSGSNGENSGDREGGNFMMLGGGAPAGGPPAGGPGGQ